jgi:hypothetical protein
MIEEKARKMIAKEGFGKKSYNKFQQRARKYGTLNVRYLRAK